MQLFKVIILVKLSIFVSVYRGALGCLSSLKFFILRALYFFVFLHYTNKRRAYNIEIKNIYKEITHVLNLMNHFKSLKVVKITSIKYDKKN